MANKASIRVGPLIARGSQRLHGGCMQPKGVWSRHETEYQEWFQLNLLEVDSTVDRGEAGARLTEEITLLFEIQNRELSQSIPQEFVVSPLLWYIIFNAV